MGAEQSNERRRHIIQQTPQMSEAQVQRILEVQRQQYEKKLEEVAAQAAAQRRQEEAAKAAAQRRQENAAKAAALRKEQEEAAKAAAQRQQEDAAKVAALRKEQEEAAKAYALRRQEEAAKAAALRKEQEEAAKAAAQRQQEDAAKVAALRKEQEEAARAYALRRQEEAAKAAALRKQQEDAAKAAAQRAELCIERDRAPYNYSANQLQHTTTVPVFEFPPIFSNLNFGPASPQNDQFKNLNPFRPRSQFEDFEFVENFAQNQSHNRRGPVPSAPAPRGCRGPSPRPRSVSRPRNAPRERDVLDCPTCYSRFGLRIFQCDNGHSSCNDCKNRGRDCGICRLSLTNRRNFELENHVSQTKAPCPHKSEGCKLFIKILDMDNHIKECPFKEQYCPLKAVFGSCHWKGKLSEISGHFNSVHPNGCQSNVDSEMQLTNVRNNSQQVHLTVLGVFNFLLHVKVSETDGKVYMAVQLIGTKFSAQKWIYEIHVYNKSDNRRKYMYTDNCCSSSDKIEDVFKAGQCAVLLVWQANTFVCNGALTYKFFIKKSNEEKRVFNKNQRGKGKNN